MSLAQVTTASSGPYLADMHPVEVNADRRGKYVEHMCRYAVSSLSFPAPLQSVDPFALRNNMSICLYGVDDDKDVISTIHNIYTTPTTTTHSVRYVVHYRNLKLYL